MFVNSLRIALFTSVFSLIALSAQPAAAVSSFETNATRDTESGTDADPQGPATTGTLFSEVIVPDTDGLNYDFSGLGYARAAADDLGRAAVDVEEPARRLQSQVEPLPSLTEKVLSCPREHRGEQRHPTRRRTSPSGTTRDR